jgi:hypothetical protein
MPPSCLGIGVKTQPRTLEGQDWPPAKKFGLETIFLVTSTATVVLRAVLATSDISYVIER